MIFFCKKARIFKKVKAPIYARTGTSGLSTGTYTRGLIEPERWGQRPERQNIRGDRSSFREDRSTRHRIERLTQMAARS